MILDDLIKRKFTVTIDDFDRVLIYPAIHPRWASRITKQKAAFVAEYRRRMKAGVGTELSHMIPKWFASKQCGCSELATRMNLLGVAWCRANQAHVTLELTRRSQCFLLARLFPQFTRRVITKWVAKAIAIAESKQEELDAMQRTF